MMGKLLVQLYRAAVVPNNCRSFTLQRSVAVMSPIKILPSFLKYQFDSPRLQTEFLDEAKGTAQKGIYPKPLGELEIAHPLKKASSDQLDLPEVE